MPLLLLATDGTVEVDAKIAYAYSPLVRDLFGTFDGDEVVDMLVPFDRAACDVVVAEWLDLYAMRISVQRATGENVALLFRALAFANYAQSNVAAARIIADLRAALSLIPLGREHINLPHYVAPLKAFFAHVTREIELGRHPKGLTTGQGLTLWQMERKDPLKLAKWEALAIEYTTRDLVAYWDKIKNV